MTGFLGPDFLLGIFVGLSVSEASIYHNLESHNHLNTNYEDGRGKPGRSTSLGESGISLAT